MLCVAYAKDDVRIDWQMFVGANGVGMTELLSTIVRTEGVKGLYRGLWPNFLKVLPAVSISYVIYEHAKNHMGI